MAPCTMDATTDRPTVTIYEYEEDPGTAAAPFDPTTETPHDAAAAAATTSRTHYTSIPTLLSRIFLPIGYPTTVRSGYLHYQLYDSLQGLSSYIRGVLCHAAVLQAVGVGNADATALAAAVTWAQKDGVGLLGGLIYSSACAHLFDAHVKEFRLLADVANDVGFLLDMMAPWCGSVGDGGKSNHTAIVYVSSAAVLCKVVCGISAGATKASITQHFAIDGNMADLNAKEATQETLMNLVGMVVGIVAARFVSRYNLNWPLFIGLTIVHIWANYKGVELLRLRTLNRARADIVLEGVIRTCLAPNDTASSTETRVSRALATVPPPTLVNESLWKSSLSIVWPDRRLRLGVPASTLKFAKAPPAQQQHQQCYVLEGNRYEGCSVSLLVGATPETELQAYLHASLVLRANASKEDSIRMDDCLNALFQTTNDDDNNNTGVSMLMSVLAEHGWETDRFYLGFGRHRSRIVVQNKYSLHSKDN